VVCKKKKKGGDLSGQSKVDSIALEKLGTLGSN